VKRKRINLPLLEKKTWNNIFSFSLLFYRTMQTFSQRMWIESQTLLQKDNMTEKLKNKIWNTLLNILEWLCEHGSWDLNYSIDYSIDNNFIIDFSNQFWLKWDTVPREEGKFKQFLWTKIFSSWNSIYDYIELLFRWQDIIDFNKTVKLNEINRILKEENSAYRVSQNGLVLPISNEEELESIHEANTNPYAPVNEHIQKAISLFKKEPADYANSIKESISAVEALCQIIIDDKKATLGKAIKKLKEKGVIIPPALEEAFNKLYGYTSNEGGIRHALSEGDTPPTFDDAKYMLVSCSAFVNYLISKMN